MGQVEQAIDPRGTVSAHRLAVVSEHRPGVAMPLDPPFEWEALLASARQFAHACVENYSVQQAAFFYLHAGASVELGIKAALCRISPVLLVEGGQRFKDQALIRLVGFQPIHAARPGASTSDARPFTVGFEQAIKRFQLLYGTDSLGVGQSALDELKAARDVTAHGGAVSEVTGETLLHVLVTLCKVYDALTPCFDLAPEEFWGELYSLVERSMREEEDAHRQQVDALVGAAQRRFQNEYGELDEDTVSAVIEQASERVQWKHGHDRRTCPVCGAQGLSRVRALKRTVIERGRPHVQRGWTAMDFRCPVCKLWLPTEDLVQLTDGLEPWDAAVDEWQLDFWGEDMGSDLDADDRELLGLDGDDPLLGNE